MKTVLTKVLEKHRTAARLRWGGPVARFLKWWVSCFVLLGPLAVCPFCGQPACGGGAFSAGVLGAIVAALTFVPRRFARFIAGRRPREEQAA
jgi:hypothetical protein